jgi:putative ABC transport system permease protein
MIRPRWKKVLADLWGNRVRSLLVIASISVGLFAVGMIVSLYYMLSEDMQASYSSSNPANIQVRAMGFDQDFTDRIRHLPGVSDAVGATLLDMRVRTGPDQYVPINIKAVPDFKKMTVNRVTVVEGQWPPADRELAVDINKLPELKAKIGDLVEIKLPSGEIRSMRLVGVVHDLTIGSASGGGGFFLAPAQGYITLDTLEWMGQPADLNQLYVTVSENPNSIPAIQQVANRVIKEFDANGYKTFNSVLRRTIDHPTSTYLEAIGSVLILLGLLVMFLSGFLITNTLSALLNAQLQQIGVMKTVGGRRFQISGIYMVLILLYSAVALALAIPLANAAAYWELNFVAGRINFIPQGQRVITEAIWLQAIIALVVPQVAGFIPILQGTRLTIQEALSGVGVGKLEESNWIYRQLSHIRGLSRPTLISLRNTFRRKVRLALTLLTLILGGAIFIATFNVRAYLDDYVARLGKYFVADVNLALDRPYRVDLVKDLVGPVPGVAAVEGWGAARVELVLADGGSGESVNLQAPPADSRLIVPIMISGRWIQTGDENAIVLSEMFMEQFPALKIGDHITLKVNDEKTSWQVVGFFQFAGKSGGLFAYTAFDSLARVTHNPGRTAVFRVVATDANGHSLAAQEGLSRRLEAHLVSLGYKVSDVRAGLSLQDSTTSGLNTLTTFLLIMSLLMAAVGSIGLMGTMSLNVMERTREIGVMRAIGASNRAIMNLVIVEGVLIGVVSWVLAALVAVPISKIMSDVMSVAIFNTPATFTYTPVGVLIWLGVVALLSMVASVIPARAAAQLTIREVLAYE